MHEATPNANAFASRCAASASHRQAAWQQRLKRAARKRAQRSARGASQRRNASGATFARAPRFPRLVYACRAHRGHLPPQATPPQTRAAVCRDVAPTPMDALPLAVALRIFALLPADARLLAAAVCRSWRAVLADPALWTRLDLSKASGAANPTSNALLRAAAARAGGQLEVLRVSLQFTDPPAELLAVLAANACTMRELVLCTDDAHLPPSTETVAALLRAAPGLRLLVAGVFCSGADALPMLRKEPPFGPLLHLKRFDLNHDLNHAPINWRTVVDGLALHASLEVVSLYNEWPEAQAESDALVDALLSLPLLRATDLIRPPASVVVRLLGSPTLKSMHVFSIDEPLLDSPASAAVLCDALRANTRLEMLRFEAVRFWRDMDAAVALLATLQVHPSLKQLEIRYNIMPAEHAAAAGAALGELIAHSPALEALSISVCHLRDAGLGPIMDVLPRARHLQKLDCSLNGMSQAFTRERLLPAVRACASLRTLKVDEHYSNIPAVREAQALLQQRH